MEWLTVLATVAGGAAALFGSVVAHMLTSREERRRSNSAERRDAYVAYLTALDGAFQTLRRLADPNDRPTDLAARADRALGDAGVYPNRQRVLLAGNPSVVSPAEIALRRLGDLQGAVRDGAVRRTVPYHNTYHPYAEALWRLRLSIRKDLGSAELTPADVDKESWDAQANCDFCQRNKAAVPAQPAPA
ncbi:MAG TPA: hypothetical protein VFY84_03285 [Jiangellales bacterium]|nr:hypothetical protein [Jiangellales bacterium]